MLRAMILAAGLFLCAFSDTAWAQAPILADLVLRGGTIYDGTGGEPIVGDLAIRGERIVGVGRFEVAGSPRVFDATSLMICPGFIDLHNHSDDSIVAQASRLNENYLRQGCTTIVTGNCGGGVVVVDEYFGKIEKHGAGTNVIHLMPHGSIRRRAMGDHDRAPTTAELDRMRAMVDQGMRDGAWGLSTGLIYTPGAYAKTEELIELAKVAARHGGIYATHMRNEAKGVLNAIDEALRIGRESGAPVHISHLKASGAEAWGLGPRIVQKIAQARAEGMSVTGDQYPYAASSTSLAATVIPLWVRDGGEGEMRRRFNDPVDGPRVRQELAESFAKRTYPQRIVIAAHAKDTSIVGKSLATIAQERGQSLVDLVIELLTEGAPRIVNFGMQEDDVRAITAEGFVATASDGSARAISRTEQPHPRSYGTFPAKIGDYAHRRGWITVQQAVRSATGLPADILSLTDRGYLRAGAVADVAVIDLAQFKDHATFDKPQQYSTGVRALYVAGELAVRDDQVTGKLAGKPLRHPGKTR
jgi:N-acyl-D-aspartate/D-glutamate deacylase